MTVDDRRRGGGAHGDRRVTTGARPGDAPDPLRARRADGRSWQWEPFLERTGGVAPDLPGFGASGQAGRLRLLDRGLRRASSRLRRPRRARAASRSSCTTGARSGSRSPSASRSGSSGWSCSTPCRFCPATAGTAVARALADAAGRRADDGAITRPWHALALAGARSVARRGPTSRHGVLDLAGSTSTTAPSARS